MLANANLVAFVVCLDGLILTTSTLIAALNLLTHPIRAG